MFQLKLKVPWLVASDVFIRLMLVFSYYSFHSFQTPGRLKLTDQSIVFKNSKTGKVEQISSSDIELVNWQRLAGAWGLRVFLKSGALHRYGGFKDSVSYC